MAFLHGKYTSVLFSDADLSSYFNSSSRATTVEVADTTTYGRGHKAVIAGMQDGSLSMSGLFDGEVGAVDEYLSNTLGSTSTSPITIIPAQSPVIGSTCFLTEATTTSYGVSAPVGDVVSATADFATASGIHSGVVLHNGVAITATGNGTSVDLGALPVSNTHGWVACLHVTANTMNSTTLFTLETSANNSTWASLGSFASVASTTTVGEGKNIIPSTVNRYVRVVRTVAGTGSITAYVSFARIL